MFWGAMTDKSDLIIATNSFRIASEEALDNRGLDILAELLDNQSNTSITEHALRALAEITYPKRCKVSSSFFT